MKKKRQKIKKTKTQYLLIKFNTVESLFLLKAA